MQPIPKILFVDDEPDMEVMIKAHYRRKLRNREIELFFARHGQEAMEVLEREPDIDVVFTDINMPVMDGLTFLGKLPEEIKVPVKAVVISAYGEIERIRKAMNAGAFDFIIKPIEFEDLEITLQKAVEESRQLRVSSTLQTKLTEAEIEKERAIQSERFKQQFLANMSHEIRTPMNAILGMARLALNTNPDPQQRKYIDAIRRSGENLLVIINDILDFSKMEAGKMEFEKINFNLQEALQVVYDTLHFKAEEKAIELIIEYDESIVPYLVGDPVRIHQILLNLAGNAVKFTEKGEVRIRCRSLGQESGQQLLRFEVHDTGIGIDQDKIASVFDSFSQASSDTTRKYGGTGLGLTISKELVEKQGGKIGLQSELGKGTCFWFELALPIGEQPPSIQKTHGELPKLKGLRILLVEDNRFNQMVAEDSLKELIEGVTIDLAENGKEALEKVQNAVYDLVLMDIQMPVMDGYEASSLIRKLDSEEKRRIPIIALTANAIKEEAAKCKEAGIDDLVTKPFEPEQLIKKIHEQTKGLSKS